MFPFTGVFFLTRRIKIAIFFTVLTLSRVCWAVYCILDLTHTCVCVYTPVYTHIESKQSKGVALKVKGKKLNHSGLVIDLFLSTG